jgi:hypothetical protein
MPLWLHGRVQCSPEFVQRSEGCQFFFASIAGFSSDFVSVVLVAPPLDAEDKDFRHSLAMWPVCQQKRQRLLSYRHFRSCCVSLPSFPRLSDKSGVFFDGWPELCCFCPEEDRAVDFLSEVEGEVRFVFSGALSDLLPEMLLLGRSPSGIPNNDCQWTVQVDEGLQAYPVSHYGQFRP